MNFLLELEEIHPQCGSNYEMWFDHRFIVYCPKCEMAWKPCESAWEQYKRWCEMPLVEMPE